MIRRIPAPFLLVLAIPSLAGAVEWKASVPVAGYDGCWKSVADDTGDFFIAPMFANPVVKGLGDGEHFAALSEIPWTDVQLRAITTVAISGARHRVIVGGVASDGRAIATAEYDSGSNQLATNWVVRTLPTTNGGVSIYDVSFRDANTGFAIGSTGGSASMPGDTALFKTTDGGATWGPIAIPWGTAVNNGTAVLALGGGVLLAAAEQSGVWRSVNDGAQWDQAVNTIYIGYLAKAGDRTYAATFQSTDSGNLWIGNADGTNLNPSGNLPKGETRAFTASEQGLFAIVAEGQNAHLYRSRPAGDNWHADTVPSDWSEQLLGCVATTNGELAVASSYDMSEARQLRAEAHTGGGSTIEVVTFLTLIGGWMIVMGARRRLAIRA